MAGAQAEAWWKARFRDRVLDAHRRLTMVAWKLGNAQGSLEAPVRAPATDATLARIVRAERALEDASADLFSAACLLGSAEELALRGGAFAPWDPLCLRDVRELRDTSAAQRSAARKLREAREFALGNACQDAEHCCVILLRLRLLLEHPLIPGVDDYLDAERLDALELIKEQLMFAADVCLSAVRSARNDVLGPSGAVN